MYLKRANFSTNMKVNFYKLLHLSFWILVLSGQNMFAQTLFGNEWINFNQTYVKIKISQEGLYKVTFNQLSQAGFITQGFNPKNIQVFNKGKQIPVLVSGESDNSFDAQDEVLFYANTNNADLDKVLYENPNDLPNEEVSLFSDENYYFLTYNSTQPGLRYQIPNLSTSGLTPESYIIYKSRLNFASNYYPGEYILEAMSLSEYIEGEGYLGSLLSKAQTANYNLSTPNAVSTAEFSPSFSFYMAGRSNALSTNSGGNNHHLKLVVNSSLNFDTLYRGYKTVRKKLSAGLGTLPAQTAVSVSSIDDIGAVTDFQALSYLEILYARSTDLSGLKSLKFSVKNNKTTSLLRFGNASLGSPVLIDFTNGTLFNGEKNGSIVSFVVNNNQQEKTYFLADISQALSTILEPFKLRKFVASEIQPFLIITNKTLIYGANAYQTYNEVRGFQSVTAFTEDIYNEFYYGFHHPLALKNFCSWAINKGNTKPTYLLLLGKGYEFPKLNMVADLVPTMGFPASDNLLTSGLNGAVLEPGLATGRIPAKTNEEIINYLDKLKTYNGLSSFIWRKNILEVTGGKTFGEVSSFGSYQNSFYERAKSTFFGAKRIQIKKDVTTPITENQTERIINETKNGIALLTYFGHGSATGTEIAFGKASDQQNKDKPAIYLVNGCSTGACFGTANSLGEDFIIAKNNGAVGWIGTTSEGVASYLGSASNNYFSNWFNKLYGSSLAVGIKQGLKEFQNNNDKLNKAHTRQYIFLGDPTLKFHTPDKPDYQIENASLFVSLPNQNAASAKLSLKLKVENIGKAIPDSLTVKVSRTLPDNSIINILVFKVKPVYNTDTVSIELENSGLNVSGNNKIMVNIDAENKILEFNELNNQAVLDIFLPGNGVKTIFPIINGIVSSRALILKAQPDDLFTKNAEYLFEIDTVANFSSAFKKSSPIINAGLFPQWSPGFALENNKTYFWRAKLNLPDDKGGSWSASSFTYILEVANGFNVAKSDQFDNLKLKNIIYNTQKKAFEFKKIFYATSIYTEGDDGIAIGEKRFRTNQSVSFSNTAFEGITLVAMNPNIQGKFFSYPSPYNSTNGPVLVNGYTGQYFWNTNDPVQVDSLIRFINQIPANYHVIGFNGTKAAFNNLNEAAKNALKSFGLSKFELIKLGEPYMFWGMKGATPGTVLEFTADYTSSTPPRAQILQYFNDLPFPSDFGSIETNVVGPSQKWNNAEMVYFSNSFDKLNFDVIGLDEQKNETVVSNNVVGSKINLANIDAKKYPYLKIRTNIVDNTEFSIPDLKHWRIDYLPLAELSFNPENTHVFYADRLNEGDSVKWSIGVTNIYDYPTDSIKASYSILKPNNIIETKNLPALPGLKPGESKTVKITESTRNTEGKNVLTINLKQPDLYVFNNNISRNFEVNGDKKEPLVNVLFDGRLIVNGEIVSPKPLISINSIDENKFLLLNDTSTVDVFIKKEADNTFKRVAYAGNELKFSPSSSKQANTSQVEYKPATLTDGNYTLKVRSKDVSGNFQENDYIINFEVINESAITNFYPYPNPVVNSMKFVFTLTGLKIPERLRIFIYTATGKVVKTVTKEELGNIKIGNNISDFTWDGTDEFGDRLANGVYFYKVDISDSSDFKHRNTQGDTYFKNNTGKIYLLR